MAGHPPGDGPPPPPRHAAPAGHAGRGDSVGPPHPHTRAHSTWVADPNSLPSGRAVGGGRAPGLRRPPQWWKAAPPGTPSRHPHSEQRKGARAPEDGRPAEGQRLTPDAPRNAGKRPPPGRPSATPTTSNAPTHQRTSHGTSAPHRLLLGTATQQWRNPRPHAKHAPGLRRWTKHTRSSGRWDSETAKETPHKGTRARTPTWRQYRSPR